MVRSMTSAVSGLRAHQTKLDVIGNNIANVNTYGFKSARVLFRDALYQTTSGASGAGNLYGGTNSNQIGYGTSASSVDVMWQTGAYGATDYTTDLMINGDGFFIVGPMTGNGNLALGNIDTMLLTRVGAFGFDENGYMVDANGNYVYGFENTTPFADDPTYNTTRLAPIKWPTDPGTGKLVDIKSVSIGGDGTVYGVDGGGNTIIAGKVAIAKVTNPSGLDSTSDSYYQANANYGSITASVAGENATGKIIAGGLELSTVDLSREFTDMITTQRGYQANSRVITVTDEMLQELVNLKR